MRFGAGTLGMAASDGKRMRLSPIICYCSMLLASRGIDVHPLASCSPLVYLDQQKYFSLAFMINGKTYYQECGVDSKSSTPSHLGRVLPGQKIGGGPHAARSRRLSLGPLYGGHNT